MGHQFTGNRVTFKNNTGSFNTILHSTIADDKPQVLKWLSSLEPRKRHQYLRESRLDGIGQWIFRTSEFQRWNAGEDGSAHSVLFCHGDPGVGKTHLSSLVIDHFYGCKRGMAVAGVYCDYLSNKEQTTPRMLGAMLKQLVGSGTIPEDIRRAFEDAKDHFGGIGPRVPELVNMLKATISQRQRVIICIDGLDESLPEHRTGLLSSLQDIMQESSNVRLLLTARPFIHSEVEEYFPGVAGILVRPTKEDTEAFLSMKLDGDTECDAMDECLRADVMEIIPKTIADIFLLVSLTIDAILSETTIHRRKEKLKQMSRGHDVGDVYAATLERIRAQKKDRARLGMEAIMWVAHSERPLKPDELCQALGAEIGSKDLNSDDTDVNPDTADNSGGTPFLYAAANGREGVVQMLLERNDVNPDTADKHGRTPFSRAAENGHEGIVKMPVERNDVNPDTADKHGRTPFSWAAENGHEGIVKMLLDRSDVNPDMADNAGRTPFSRAAENGHEGIGRMLLERNDVNPGKPDNAGRTPFSWAAEYGREGVVKMLLERSDVNPDTADKHDRTPFSSAADHGYTGPLQFPEMGRDLSAKSALREEASAPSAPEYSELPQPPLKRTRRI